MIRDSRPKGSLDLDHVLHFAKRFDDGKKQILADKGFGMTARSLTTRAN